MTRRITLFTLGGTIAMTNEGGGARPALSGADLMAAVPGLDRQPVDVEVEDFRQLPGASLRFEDLAALTDAVDRRLDAGADGIVVSQGTDTIEEAAYYLDLRHTRPEPVVVTGAMRNPTLAGADGPANLLAALEVATSPDARGRGCLVVMADEIHAARRVRKTHSSSLTAFQSPTGGPVGYVIGGSPRFLSPAHDRPVIPTDPGRSGAAPRVGLVVTSLGDDGAMLDGMAQRYDGLVVAGFGVGHVPAGHVEPLEGLAATIPVVLTSRTGAGPVLLSTYSFPGSELDLLARGLIPAGLLDPYKARILLHLLIATGCDRSTIHDAFEAAGGHTDPSSWPWPPQDGPGVEA